MRRFAATCLIIAFTLLNISTVHVSAQEDPQYYIVISDRIALVRSEPVLTAEIVTVLTEGTIVQVFETVEGSTLQESSAWYKIRFNQEDAFVHSSNMQTVQVITGQPVDIAEPEIVIEAPIIEPAPENPLYTVTVTGIGTASIDSDMVIVELGLEKIGSQPESTYNRAMADSDRTISALIELDLDPLQHIHSEGSLIAEDIRDADGRITGEFVYRAQFSLIIILTNPELLDDVINIGLSNGANVIHSVTFTKQNVIALEDLARTNALNRAIDKANQIAESLNARLVNPIEVREISVTVVQPSGLQNAIANGTLMTLPDIPTQVTATVEIQVTFTFQPLANLE